MDANEFRQWVDYHSTAYPALTEWLDRNPGTLRRWERVLSDVTLESAKAASDAMLNGDLDEPRGYSAHPKAIRAYRAPTTEATTAEYISGERVYSCPDCEDSGTVVVFHALTQRAIKEGEDFAAIPWRTCAVACHCHAGDRWHPRLPRYDSRRMFRLVGFPTQQNKQSCWEWLTRSSEPVSTTAWQPHLTYDEVTR